uniref:HhpV n=1 Tax=Byssochlamys spectabilis TaxID=264951 RepID=A0A7M4CBV9_BYSSP|nr:HhpV [Paecilomyces variotii]
MSIGEYSVDHFQNLPSLEIARTNFMKLNGDDLVKDVFKKFFIEQGMDRTFGLAMLHRHFDLEPGEMLVDYEGTSVPWNAGHVSGMKPPQPAIWAVSSDGEFKPTEFYFSEGEGLTIGEEELRFMKRFQELLHEHKVTQSFGLCRYPGDDFNGLCEITHGRANINLKPNDWPKDLSAVDTAWFFSEPIWTRGCRCTCNASSPDHPHGVHIYTMSG